MIRESHQRKSRAALLALMTLGCLGPGDALSAETPTQQAQLRRIAQVVKLIKEAYVDPVEDRRLVRACREGMQRWAHERPGTRQPSDSGVPSSTDALAEIEASYAQIAQQLSSPESDEKLAVACMQAMVGEVDRQGEYLAREDLEAQYGTAPGVGGVGLHLTADADLPKIVFSIEGAPAYRAGLKSGDHIVKIDDTLTRGVPLHEVHRRLRGEPGSTVRLSVIREGEREPVELTLTRERFRVESVRWRLVNGGYLHLRIARFVQGTLESVAAGLQSAYRASDKGLQGVILDLRNNSGGLLNECVGVAAAFLPRWAVVFDPVVVETRGRAADDSKRYYARPEDYLRGTRRDPVRELPQQIRTVPVIVLVNAASTTCAEIVAAALQDHRRAKLVGRRTFGRGTLQTMVPMDGNTVLKITTERVFRPSGAAIESVGVVPDVVHDEDERVLPEFGSANDRGLSKGIAVLESDSRR